MSHCPDTRNRHPRLLTRCAVAVAAATGLALSSLSAASAGMPADPGSRPAAGVNAGGTASTTPPLPMAGVQYRGNWGYTQAKRIKLLNKLQAAGVEWLRIGIPWASVQPRKPTSSDSGFSQGAVRRVDQIIGEAHARGFQVSVTLNSTPRWANGGRGRDVLPTRAGDYARAARWMAQRYRGKVQSWEVYNEPNLDKKLKTTPKEYVRLLCASYPAIRKGAPGATVVMGGTAGNDWKWVQRAYAAGAKGCFDVLATHPYQGEARPPSFSAPNDKRWWFQNVSLVREVMLRHGDGGSPIWFTEIGWSTHPGVVRKPGVTLQQQADYVVQLFRFTAKRYPYVDRISWYQARNEPHGDAHRRNYGLYYQNMEPKPAVSRLRQLLSS